MINFKKKVYIPIDLKNRVWHKHSIYPLNKEITQCCTCTNFVLIPEAIRHLNSVTYDIQPIYINGIRKQISGVAEFGHIVSENNGGQVNEENLIIQCKTCNTRQGTNNIEKYQFMDNCEMIDAESDNDLEREMGEYSAVCLHMLTSGQRCKNKPMFNRVHCHIHLKE